MAINWLKKAQLRSSSSDDSTEKMVRVMLKKMEEGGEEQALLYAKDLDGYEGPGILSDNDIDRACEQASQSQKDDIEFAIDRVERFAKAQLASIGAFEVELSEGLWAGQRLIPVEVAGCYVPSGRYAHIASAIMSIITARTAGVKHVIASSLARSPQGPDPILTYTMHRCGADTILNLGGVQAIYALAKGFFTGKPANILVGPGNRFVAEAKRLLYGQVGIDMFAGPTEIAIIADASADPSVVATDLVSQAEHGPDSPAWLISTSDELARLVMAQMPSLIEALPDASRKAATSAWRDYGEVCVCDTDEQACAVSDEYAAEHLQVQTQKNEWYLENLRNYGSLFLGEETTVTYGDKCSGTNHILPTKGASRYTGGLSVHKFLKIVTTQRMTRNANEKVGAVAARISRMEGMEAHARSADIRLQKYFPS